MINKIHQNMRETLYQLAQAKKMFLVDKSQNNMLLVCANDNFQMIEKFVKKEFSITSNEQNWKLLSPMYQIKEFFAEKDKVKYKIRVGLTEHLDGHKMSSLMVSVNI